MAFDPIFKMTLQNAAGAYYTAVQNADNTWVVSPVPGIHYLDSLPEGWDETTVEWQRDTSYMGIFRGQSNSDYKFSGSSRAIIQYIMRNEGLIGYCTLSVWKWDNYDYALFYSSQLDFKTYSDDLQTHVLSIGTLDSDLIRDIHSKGDTKMNIPIWLNTEPPGVDPNWVLNDAVPVLHKGIKLMYNARYTSSAKLGTTDDGVGDDPLWYTVSPTSTTPGGRELGGFNHGAVGDGYHILPCMNQYSQITNNGTVTFIGNDILQPFLIQGNQIPGAANFASESNFSAVNHSQPYTRNNFVLKSLLPNQSRTITMKASVRGTFRTSSDPSSPSYSTTLGASNLYADGVSFIRFVLFEIDTTNTPVLNTASGRYCYQVVCSMPLNYSGVFTGVYNMNTAIGTYTDGDFFDNTDTPETVIISYDKAYAFGIIYDDGAVYLPTDPDPGAGIIGSRYLSFGLGSLILSIRSDFDSGVSGSPVDAPFFPESLALGFRPDTLLSKLVPYLATRTTDGYGFPVPVTTDYEGVSEYLADPSATEEGDMIPWQTIFTSAYCLHNLQGRSYLSMSLNELFDFCKKRYGCGAYVLGNTFYIERLRDIFNKDVMILDLAYDVADLRIEAVSDNIGCNLKLGYSKQETNKDAGIDSFNTELYFNTPLANYTGVMDYQERGIVTEMYAIEKIRAQRVNQPIGQTYDPSNPSGNNITVALYCDPVPVSYLEFDLRVYNPSNVATSPLGGAYPVSQYTNAQSTDSTASVAPYVYGLMYPDTAINLELSPCRALQTGLGAQLHSVLHQMDADYLTFRATTVMQYNNEVTELSGIESNLNIGSGASGVVSEFSDKLIGNLPDPLYKPYLIKVKSKYPVNMYSILNTNPNGYVRFFWQEQGYDTKEYKFFITKASQVGATGMATEFIGVLHPDIDI